MDKQTTQSSLADMLRDGSLYHRAPPYLRARILADLPRKPSRQGIFTWGMLTVDGTRAWLNGGLAGLAVCMLALSAAVLLQRPAPATPIAQEIVASHVRALLSQHPIDVISTDQHTVKPWFNGRLDYAPPVADFSAQGFPLVGGRIDYVEHRTVAVLVYRYQKHPIDLYVFPDKGDTRGPATKSTDGYSIAHWRQGGMSYWAITDAEPAHLAAFRQAVQGGRALGAPS